MMAATFADNGTVCKNLRKQDKVNAAFLLLHLLKRQKPTDCRKTVRGVDTKINRPDTELSPPQPVRVTRPGRHKSSRCDSIPVSVCASGPPSNQPSGKAVDSVGSLGHVRQPERRQFRTLDARALKDGDKFRHQEVGRDICGLSLGYCPSCAEKGETAPHVGQHLTEEDDCR